MPRLLPIFFVLLSFPVLCYSQCTADCFPPISNLEIGREVSASSQCTTEFCISGESSAITCSSEHGPSSINDEDPDSYWVSEVNISQTVTLQVDFENPVLFEGTILTWPFHASDSLILERSSDNGTSWSPYIYFSRQCKTVFGMPGQDAIPGMKFPLDEPICALPSYSSYVPTTEGVVSQLLPRFAELSNKSSNMTGF